MCLLQACLLQDDLLGGQELHGCSTCASSLCEDVPLPLSPDCANKPIPAIGPSLQPQHQKGRQMQVNLSSIVISSKNKKTKLLTLSFLYWVYFIPLKMCILKFPFAFLFFSETGFQPSSQPWMDFRIQACICLTSTTELQSSWLRLIQSYFPNLYPSQ